MTTQYTDIRHICFDKDGTLIDVHLYWSDIIQKRARRMLENYSLDQKAMTDLCKAMGIDLSLRKILPGGPVGYKPRPVIIEAARSTLARYKVNVSSDEIAPIFVAVDKWMQENSAYEIKLLPGVKESLAALSNSGFKMSVYTSDRRENLRKILKVLDLERYFDVLIGGDDVKQGKPHPEGFLMACEKVGVSVQKSSYVGDTADDMEMAHKAGAAACLGVATGLDSEAVLRLRAHDVVHSLDKLPAILLKGK